VAAAVRGPVARRKLARSLELPERRLTALLNLLEAAGTVRLGRRVQPAADAPPPEEAAAIARERAERHRGVERSRGGDDAPVRGTGRLPLPVPAAVLRRERRRAVRAL